MRVRPLLLPALVVALLTAGAGAQQAPAERGGAGSITEADLSQWLTYLSSDELQGRATYTEGLGLAAGYIAAHLRTVGRETGRRPRHLPSDGAGAGVTDQQPRVGHRRGQRSVPHVQGRRGHHVLPADGRQQTIEGRDIAFVGYGLRIPAAQIDDYAEGNPKGKVVVCLGPAGAGTFRRALPAAPSAAAAIAIEQGAVGDHRSGGRGWRAGQRRGGASPGRPVAPASGQSAPGAAGAASRRQPPGGRGPWRARPTTATSRPSSATTQS